MHAAFSTSIAVSLTSLLAASAGAQIVFDSATPFSTPAQPDGVAAADYNGDGHIDLAVTTDAPDKITFLLGDGLGSFSQGGSLQTGSGTGPGFIVAADMDGDLDQDLVVALKNINTVRVYINTGGAFAAGASAGVGAEPRGIFVADFDGDGDMDAATANRAGNSVSVLLNQNGTLAGSTVPVGQEPRMITGGDFNGGGVDLAVTNHDDRTISILSNNGAGGFSVTGTLLVNQTTRPEGIDAGDMDGDGDIDLVAATNDDNLNFVTVFLNGGGTFSGPFDYNAPGSQADQVALADFDGDGDMDAIVSNDATANVVPMENTGGGALVAAAPVSVGATPGTFAIADFDSNQSPDAAVATRDSNQTWVLLNGVEFGTCPADFNGDGQLNILDFVAFQGAFVGGDPSADVNGDGQLNILDFVAFQGLFQAGCA